MDRMTDERLNKITETCVRISNAVRSTDCVTEGHANTGVENTLLSIARELFDEVKRLRADKTERFILKSDDDGHWYVVPADKDREAADYFESVSKYWDNPPSDENSTEPDRPEWLEDVGGCPSLVTFANPIIGAGF